MNVSLILSPAEIKRRYPLSATHKRFLLKARQTAQAIVSRQDKRRACIIGPCSIHDKLSALEYAKCFKKIAHEVADTCFLVMRVYFEKPRTSRGWKGLLYDPHLDASHDIHTGLLLAREILLLLAEWEIPTATEFLDPLAACYFEELITWGFIGARTSASQIHRQFASSLSIPLGFKNSTEGNLDHAICGVGSAGIPHTFLSIDEEGRLCKKTSQGNPFAHIVLRGARDFTNYDARSVAHALERLQQQQLPLRLMIDCSHGNCQKQGDRQKEVFLDVIEQLQQGNDAICGLMLESHLEKGFQSPSQDLSSLKHTVSITDPCIDWPTTEELIYSAHTSLSGINPSC